MNLKEHSCVHHNTVHTVWFDLGFQKVERAQHFYGELFGWSFQPRSADDSAWEVRAAEGAIGGLVPQQKEAVNPTIYINVSDCAKSTQKAEELGATVHLRCLPVAGLGFVSFCHDSEGNRIAFVQKV